VVNLRGVARSGDTGRGTVSCLTRVRSVKILAIMNKEGLGGVAGVSDLTERSRGAEGAPVCCSCGGVKEAGKEVGHLVW